MTKRQRWNAAWLVTVGCTSLVIACSPSPGPTPGPMLVADPPPTENGAAPGEGLADLDRGIAFIENEAYAEAIPYLDRAIAAQPENAKAEYYRAVARERLGKLDEAEAGYARAIELDPKLLDATINLAALYLDDTTGASRPPRPQKAIALLKSALKQAPAEDEVDLRANLAYAHRLARAWDESADQYRAALKIEDRPSLRFALGDMLFEADRCKEAGVELSKAIDGHRKELRVLVTIADELGRCKQFSGCVEALDGAVALQPKEPNWYVRRGVCWHGAGVEEKARADFDKALQQDPNYAPAHYYLGVSYRVDKQRLKAVNALEKAAKLDPDGPVGKKAKEELKEIAAQDKRR